MRLKNWKLWLMSLAFPAAALAAEPRPAVLFYGTVHHAYVAKPLAGMGIDIDTCAGGELAKRLASGKYNVVVVGDYMNGPKTIAGDAERKALDDFMAKGGGVFITKPQQPYVDNWTRMNEWLTRLGARPRWELLQEGDRSNVVTDVMNVQHSWSDQIDARVKDGVRGVLTYVWHSSGGNEPSQSYDLDPEWTVLVRGASTMKAVPDTRNDVAVQAWVPKNPVLTAPPLLAAREVGKGRLAVWAIPYSWAFPSYPPVCPSIEITLTQGAGGRPSDWLRVCANTFKWLAEPSLKARMGGAPTPSALLEPPSEFWPLVPELKWSDAPMEEHRQYAGLVGARTALSTGSGSVADYVKEAKAAGLQFIVFLEDSLKMDQGKWDQLVRECDQSSDTNFAAIPGLTLVDAQDNHMYAFSDKVSFPKPAMLLSDKHLATTQTMRSRAWFDYINEFLGQDAIMGFWNHKANLLPVADYKLYNSFPIYSAEDGKPVDAAFDDYRYLMGSAGCHAALALEFMSNPKQVAARARDGWRVMTYRPPAQLRTEWHTRAMTFSGMDYAQYITRGPTIPVWESPNRMAETHGEWWRPDIAEYRLRFRAASDEGLKSVTLYDGENVFRRWLPGGAKAFDRELVLANGQQRGLYLVVEDTQGRQAISMEFWVRNLLMASYLLTDRCNFMGDCRLRTPKGDQFWTPVGFRNHWGIPPNKGVMDLAVEPSVWLTVFPTLPVDGAPGGTPPMLTAGLSVPGELRWLFSSPSYYLVAPEIAVGQVEYQLGYDPAEENAKATALGYEYVQPQQGNGNAWCSWHKLIPTRKLSGWSRTYAANTLTPDSFRIGWQETSVRLKEPVTLEKDKDAQVMYSGSKTNWVIYQDGKRVAGPETGNTQGSFRRGTLALLEDPSGATVVMAMDDRLEYRYVKDWGWRLLYATAGRTELPKDEALHCTVAFAGANGTTPLAKMLEFAEKFGVTKPGTTGYSPRLTRGKQLDNYLLWRLQADAGQCVEAKIPKADLPGFLTTTVEGLNDNWSVYLLDKARARPNYRSLPIRDGTAWAQLDVTQADSDLFIGHPVVADKHEVKLLVAWQEPGVWFVEAHNPGDKAVGVKLSTSPGWNVFDFKETADLPAGSSQVWRVKAK